MSTSLIPADQHFAVMAALFAISFFGFWAEKQSWGKLVTGTVWAILAAILASNINLIPKSADAYSFVFKYLVPALIPLFLINANVKRIILESGRVGIGFVLACIGSAAGAIVGVSLLDLGAKEADLAGIFTATYTGGSVNYAAVIQSTGFDDANIISAATAVDNLMSAVFLAVLAIMPASKWLMNKFAERDHHLEETTNNAENQHSITGFSLAAALTFALLVVALSDATVALLSNLMPDYNIGRLRYVFITLYSIIPATIAPATMHKLQGGETVGIVLAFVFFAAIAAGADVVKLLSVAPILLAFVIIILLIHGLFVFGLGAAISALSKKLGATQGNLFRLSLPELIIASNAAILGATTAPALAMARGWPALATPGILAGVAGYIVGTPLGLLVASLA